ncbi:PssE/Cps14G family polysaccharide biosynthesis glycosyltransferase [Enterococcus casseliflavus]|uniref:PssE/Cps14G family polysaccharide biosynthesis glycosyltransferase n=1 Tax=Enterococcus casseliflavus TaxID=37734 RepID=UPI0022E0B742|nr:PssE/Cps14G family polysaccharide biosynthesis glycosyltransferase [Enterococcus casseliflavus]
MIFISLGSQKFQFNRLLKIVDKLIEENIIKDKVFAQIGVSDYVPLNYEYCKFLDADEFNSLLYRSEYIITHAGTGAIVNSLKKGKKVIVVPRLSECSEHVDNHQQEIAKVFEESNLVMNANDYDGLVTCINRINNWQPDKFVGNNSSYIDFISRFITQERE